MLTGSLAIADKYDYLAEKFIKGYRFLQTADLMRLPLGRVDIDGDELFADVQEYTTRDAADCAFEAHNRYFDIQYVVAGEERFGCAKRSDLTAKAPYNAEDDIIFFREPKQAGSILLKAGDFAVAAPEDAHKPRCATGAAGKVRKIVLKVRV